MSDTQKEKAKRDKRIFRKFAKVFGYDIDLNSIAHFDDNPELRKRYLPPKPQDIPDIFCRLLDGTEIAFELSQCVDPS